jgi:hypothetical protein
MFGWEKQMNAKIADKREEELKKLWRRRLLDLAGGMLKCGFFFRALPLLTFRAVAISFLF